MKSSASIIPFSAPAPGESSRQIQPSPGRVPRFRPAPRWTRLVSLAMLPMYYLTSLPAYAQAQVEQAAHEIRTLVAESLKPAPYQVKVNRTLPTGVVDDNAPAQPAAAGSVTLRFSTPEPKDREFFEARLFTEPLIPTEAKAADGENAALAKALVAYAQAPAKASGDVAERVAPILQFLAERPNSRWALALALNLGLLYRKAGYWTRALDAWEKAWAAGKKAVSPNARALADRAVAELAELNARLGRYERLTPLFDEIDSAGRDLRGAAADKLAGARQGLWMMDNQPEISFRCGPMALNCLRLAENPKAPLEPKLFNSQSTRQGISLTQVAALSRDIGRPMQMAFRASDQNGKGAEFLTPAVVHWKAGHYAALVEQKGGRYRVDDPTFGDTNWVAQAVLETETDGYYLVAADKPLPAGWRSVAEAEGGKVWGKGTTGPKDPNATKCTDLCVRECPQCNLYAGPDAGGDGSGGGRAGGMYTDAGSSGHASTAAGSTVGMAAYNIQAMLTSLSIGDTPLSYTPPRGRPIKFSVQYSQHEASQPAVFTSWNLGPKWTSQWTSYIEDSGTAYWYIDHWDSFVEGNVTYYTPVWAQAGGIVTGSLPVTHLPGGGLEYYQAPDQINSFSYPGISDGGSGSADIFFAYASQDQSVAYQNKPIAGIPVSDQTYDPVTRTWIYGTYDSNTNSFTYPFLVRPRLVQTGHGAYKRYLPDGTVENYGHPDRAGIYPRRIFLTERKDPSGNTMSFGYDNSNRLIAVTDALGQVTTLGYELGSDPLKVTTVTDPFGRSCHLAYNVDGQLASITDTVGIQSSFTYAAGDFIDSLTTPYGTSTFAFGDVTTDPTMGVAAWLEATDPYGDIERAEFRHNAPGIPFNESIVPQGIPVFNEYINARNTYYWDKKTYKEAKQGDGTFDYTKANIFHFLHSTDINMCSGILESTKLPLENRVWLGYQGQTWAGGISTGMSPQPSLVARVLDDGSSQLYQYQYNDQQRLTLATDPLGRQIAYDYDPANNIDLLAVRRTTGGLNEQLMGATYNAAHQPLTTTDAAGQTTTLAYNGFGQPLTVTDPANRTTTCVYDGQGYLQEIDGFDPALRSTFAYDGFGRLAGTTSYPDGYTVQVGYDAVDGDPLKSLNRPVSATFPDGSYTQVDYTLLDAEWLRDRGGNWTHRLTNKLRQTVASIDALGSVTQFGFCKCGQLVKIVDANGNVTQWKLDAQERPYGKVYADNTEVTYTYEQTTSRLKRVTDAKGQQTNYAYNLDGSLQGVTYTNAEHATPAVAYTYDPQRGQLATMADGIGTTTYSYYPFGSGGAGTLGAGRLQSVSGPFANESVSYAYDALGRTVKRTVDGVDETYGFDGLGRLQTDTNALGAFTYGYDGVTSRLSSVAYPNGQQALYGYLEDNTQGRRLAQIKHLLSGGAVLDQFDYSYDGPLGRIAHWGQQQPGAAAGTLTNNAYDLSYDAIGQLRRAVLNGDSANAGSGVWSYDPAGNRVGVQAGSGTVSTATPTATNALFSVQGGGSVRVAGNLDKWASVTVNGQAASSTNGGTGFEAFVPLPAGNQTVSITATDASGNTATSRYQLTITAGVSESFAYDLNGNTTWLTPTAAPAQSLEWDARDRVVAINTGSHRTEFGYDGSGARVRITEKDNGSVTTDRLYVANEERDTVTGQVLRAFYAQGEQRAGGANAGAYFYAGDHLGSLRELTDASGSMQASYGYDVWGARTKLQGSLDAEVGFTGYWHHSPSGLELSPTRAYSAGLSRFVSRDPIREAGGINLYGYCVNDPVNNIDPLGLLPPDAIPINGPAPSPLSPAAVPLVRDVINDSHLGDPNSTEQGVTVFLKDGKYYYKRNINCKRDSNTSFANDPDAVWDLHTHPNNFPSTDPPPGDQQTGPSIPWVVNPWELIKMGKADPNGGAGQPPVLMPGTPSSYFPGVTGYNSNGQQVPLGSVANPSGYPGLKNQLPH